MEISSRSVQVRNIFVVNICIHQQYLGGRKIEFFKRIKLRKGCYGDVRISNTESVKFD